MIFLLLKFNFKYIILNGMRNLTFVWRAMPIKSYEPCQVRKEAAISSVFYVVIVFHRDVRGELTPFLILRGEHIGIYSTL